MPESQPVPHEPQRTRSGFTLLELSVSIGIIALMLSGTLTIMSDFAVKQESLRTKDDLQVISDAIVAYKDRNGRLPCPASQTVVYGSASYGRQVNAGDCSYTTAPAGTTRTETAASSGKWVLSGAVPVRDLLLRDSFMKDKFGNRITYVVPQVLASASTFAAGEAVIKVKRSTGDDVALDGAFALISHGLDGKGAYREGSGALKQACGASTNLDVANCTPGATIMDAPFNDGQVAASYFDDTVVWKSKVDIVDLDPADVGPDFTGFRVDGATSADALGFEKGLATGDVNGDGYEDLIGGALHADPNGRNDSGYSYVVFGSAVGVSTPFDLALLNGTNGFRLDGLTASDFSGFVTSGDVNGDGFDDVIIGATGADPGGNSSAGSVYVVFGKASGWAATIDLATLNGTTGFRLDGAAAGDTAGNAVASGDINNDGFDDVIIGATGADPGGNSSAGSVYVVFGKASGWASTTALSSLNGTTGFRLDGGAGGNYSGIYVSSGDINNDGYDDVIVGSYAEYTYVVFGKAGAWAATTALSSLNGTTGFRLDGSGGYAGRLVVSGNVNGDAYDDIIIRAPTANSFAGYTYVVFGKAGVWAATTALSTLNGTTGFRLDGAVVGFFDYFSLSSGDLNGDGFDEVIVGDGQHSPNSMASAGSTYVVFGKASGWAATTALSTLNGTTGFRLDGSVAGDGAGFSVSSGDITGDGKAEILIAGPGVDNNSRGGSGSVYGIYGRTGSWSATYELNTITVP